MSRPTTHNVINADTNPKGEDEDDMTDTLDNVPDEALEGLANPDPAPQGSSTSDPAVLIHEPSDTINIDPPPPQWSHQHITLTEWGASMKGLPHVSRTGCTVNEMKASMEHLWEMDQDALPATEADYWIPMSSNSIESAILSCDTDPKLWKEAMASYNAAEWEEGLKEEMDSLWAHEVFTLVPKSSVPKGRRIVK